MSRPNRLLTLQRAIHSAENSPPSLTEPDLQRLSYELDMPRETLHNFLRRMGWTKNPTLHQWEKTRKPTVFNDINQALDSVAEEILNIF